jgi:WD40 repeat protein
MRRIWLTLGALALLMLGIAVVSAVVIMATWPTLSEEEQFQPIHAVAFFPDGCRFATMNNAGPVRIWDVKTGKELKRFTPGGWSVHDAGTVAMAVSRDGRYLAGASNRAFPDKYGVQVWDVATGQEVGSFVGHSEMVKAVAFTPDGRSVLSAGSDKTIRVWDIATGRELHCLRGHKSHLNALAVTPDGRYAISGAGDYDGGQLHDPTIRMWELDGGSMVRAFEGHSGSIHGIAVSPDGKLMASVSWDTSVRIWNLSSGEQMQAWMAPRGIFNAASFSPNGKNLLTGSAYSAEGAVQLWDVATGQELRVFGLKTITHDVAFAPDGKTLMSAQEITVPAPPPHPFALMYAKEFQAGIAVVSDVETAKELLRVGEVPRPPAQGQSK